MVVFRLQFPCTVVVGLLGSVLLLIVEESFAFVNSGSSSSKRTPIIHPTFVYDYHYHNGDSSRVCLDAKAKNKKKKKSSGASSSVGGGFGKVTTVTKKEVIQDDYASFPRLEPGVLDTLLPVTEDMIQRSDLMDEVYDRLGQIYGFDNFNGELPTSTSTIAIAEEEEDTTSPMSMNDLLSMDDDNNSSSEDTYSVVATTTAQSDFSNLLDEIKSTSGSTTTKATSTNSDLNDLISAAVSGDDTATTTAVEEPPKKKTPQKKLDIFQLKQFSKINVLHLDPLVLTVDDFLTDEECDKYVRFCTAPKKHTSAENMPLMISSKTVGKDKLSKSQRSSTTWYHHYKNVPELMAKASRLLGLETIDRWEEPQTVRYRQSEKYTWHLDALAPSDDLKQTGGQRTATLLVYLADMGDENAGGATMFRDLGNNEEEGNFLKVQPKKGSALLFFPSAGGIPNCPFDIRTLHAGEAVSDDATSDKWIAQLWMRENNNYKPTGPPGNSHAAAYDAIDAYCKQNEQP